MQAVAAEHPDLVLLDLGLPGIDGIGVIQALRGWTTVPIIVLTVRDDERSKVEALDAGADDYVTKPFGMAELLARISAALRRAPDGARRARPRGGRRRASGSISPRTGRSSARRHDDEVHLTGTEWPIVGLPRPQRRPAGDASRSSSTAVWGPRLLPNPNLLRVHMANIRRKLEREPVRAASTSSPTPASATASSRTDEGPASGAKNASTPWHPGETGVQMGVMSASRRQLTSRTRPGPLARSPSRAPRRDRRRMGLHGRARHHGDRQRRARHGRRHRRGRRGQLAGGHHDLDRCRARTQLLPHRAGALAAHHRAVRPGGRAAAGVDRHRRQHRHGAAGPFVRP